LNLSVLDGWWAEGFRPQAGWALQEERTYSDQRYQDELDAETIYNLIENEIVSLYFNRNEKGIPTQWVKYVKNNLMQIAPNYTMKRMLDDYFAQYYNKLIERTDMMRENRYQKAFEIAAWKKNVETNWDKIEVEAIKIPDPSVRSLNFGDAIVAEITLKTPGLNRGDVGIEIVFGTKDKNGNDKVMKVEQLQLVDAGEGWARYYINLPLNKAGMFDYTFRIYPTHELLPHRQDFALVKWI
jgi:glucan phosphorylase